MVKKNIPGMVGAMILVKLVFFSTVLFVKIPHVCAVEIRELRTLSNVILLNHQGNDGDSFHVKVNGEEKIFRLYFVDCPETTSGGMGVEKRIEEQKHYWGLSGNDRVIYWSKKAKAFVKDKLDHSFTVYAGGTALGSSSIVRKYAFITTEDGKDLAALLVQNGLARPKGKGRKTLDGMSSEKMRKRLKTLEDYAQLKRLGIWADCNPDEIIKPQVKKDKCPQEKIDPNTATKEELMCIKGIGPIFAERIIAGRPHKTIENLLKVKGIAKKRLEEFRPYLHIDSEISR